MGLFGMINSQNQNCGPSKGIILPLGSLWRPLLRIVRNQWLSKRVSCWLRNAAECELLDSWPTPWRLGPNTGWWSRPGCPALRSFLGRCHWWFQRFSTNSGHFCAADYGWCPRKCISSCLSFSLAFLGHGFQDLRWWHQWSSTPWQFSRFMCCLSQKVPDQRFIIELGLNSWNYPKDLNKELLWTM